MIISKLKSEFKGGETKFELQMDVLNEGGGPAVGWFRVVASLGGVTLETWNIFDGLQVGVAPVFKYKAKINGSITGQLLTITADTDNGILESNETNNTVSEIMN